MATTISGSAGTGLGSTMLIWYSPAQPGVRPAYLMSTGSSATPFSDTFKLDKLSITAAAVGTANVAYRPADPSPVAYRITVSPACAGASAVIRALPLFQSTASA